MEGNSTALAEPADEGLRLEALFECAILDTDPEQAFDDIVLLASQACQTPIALVSLVDTHRQWFKARVGLAARQTPRHVAFCAHAILHPAEVFLVGDTHLDERFRNNPLVTGEPHIRFYAGAPLLSASGHPLGTVCVIDRVPRQLDDRQFEALRACARLASEQLQTNTQDAALKEAEQERLLSESRFRWLANQSSMLVWSCGPDLRWDWVNRWAVHYSGRSKDQLIKNDWAGLLHPDDAATFLQLLQNAARRHHRLPSHFRLRRHDGVYEAFSGNAIPRFQPDGLFSGFVGVAASEMSGLANDDQSSD